MNICIAQIRPVKGNIQQNIQTHLHMVSRAVTYNADFILFPELSITGYEPTLVKVLSADIEGTIRSSFQDVADKYSIFIAVGVPLSTEQGITISLYLFQPNTAPLIYSKQALHKDEYPYFIGGDTQVVFDIKGEKIAFGICYESLLEAHFMAACKNGAEIYLASVAKSEEGIEKACTHYSLMASNYSIPVFMSNCIGMCDQFMSAGQSAIWNPNGECVAQLSSEMEGLLIYDTESADVNSEQLSLTN